MRGGSAGRPFLKPFFLIRENFFQSFRTKFSSSFYVISLASKISYCLSANHNPELRCVICTGVTLFAPVLHFLHLCYTWTALLSANQNRVIFSCILLSEEWSIKLCIHNSGLQELKLWIYLKQEVVQCYIVTSYIDQNKNVNKPLSARNTDWKLEYVNQRKNTLAWN